jgi:hypothetical protein
VQAAALRLQKLQAYRTWSGARWLWPLAALSLVVATGLLWLPMLDLPLHIDAGYYATVAYWWARGDTLYREIGITRPQGIFVVYRLIESVGLGSVRGIHVAAACCAAACTLALLAVAGRVWGRGIGLGAAALFALVMATPYLEGPTANAELFMLLPLLGSLYLLLRADDGPLAGGRGLALVAGAGGLAALALLIKPSGFAGLVLGALWLARRWRREAVPWRAWLIAEGALGLGFLAGLAPALLHGLLTVQGSYLDIVFLHRLNQDSALANGLTYQFGFLLAHGLAILVRLPILLIAPVGAWLALRGEVAGGERGRDLLWLWLLTAFAGMALGGNWWFHYFQQDLPPLAVATVLGLRALARRPRGPAQVALQGVALAGILSLAMTMLWLLIPPADPAKLIADYKPTFSSAEAVAAHLRERTAPDERIYVAYHQPDIYYLAQRRPAAHSLDWRELKWTPGAFDEQVERLANPATAPRYVVAAQPFDNYGFDDDGALRAVIERDYRLETTIGGIPLYRRND